MKNTIFAAKKQEEIDRIKLETEERDAIAAKFKTHKQKKHLPRRSRLATTNDVFNLERLAFSDGTVIFGPDYAVKTTRAEEIKEIAIVHESTATIEQIDEFERLHPTLPGDPEEKEAAAALNREAALRSLVPALDTNEDGFIDREEMQRAMPGTTDEGLGATMRACDLDGDGKVDADEWVAFVLQKEAGKDDVQFVEGVKRLCRVLEAPLHTAVLAARRSQSQHQQHTHSPCNLTDNLLLTCVIAPSATRGSDPCVVCGTGGGYIRSD